jgi:NADH-quinone oxidoreductase subunit L
MVTAGVYMIARAHVIFDRSPFALSTVAIIGVATAFFAATIGLVQTDIKRVLAYSTISQLGYMFLACGVAAYSAGIFHLVTHAFFKALLFLAAGSVIHALSGEQDMRAMGGLRKKIPITFWTMTAAVLAISGAPPLAGFVSKDEILYQTFLTSKLLWSIGLLTAGLTSFYMFRLWYLTFFGESRAHTAAAHHEEDLAAVHARSDTKVVLETEHAAHPVHESPWVMLGPLVILAILSVIGGFMGWPEAFGGSNWFSRFLDPVVATGNAAPAGDSHLEFLLALVSIAVAFFGWLTAHILYYAKPALPARLATQLRVFYSLLKNKYWVDEIYGVLIDRGVIDGGTLTAGYTAQGFGALVARIQSGNIRSYAGWLAFFAALLLAVSYFGWTSHFYLR